MLTATIVTTDAVGELAEIHDRMPLMLDEQDWDRWLDPDEPAPADLLAAPPDISGIGDPGGLDAWSTASPTTARNSSNPSDRDNQPVGLF